MTREGCDSRDGLRRNVKIQLVEARPLRSAGSGVHSDGGEPIEPCPAKNR